MDNIRSCSSLKEAQKFSKKISPTFDGVRDLESQMANWATFNVVIRIVRGQNIRILFESLLYYLLKFVFVFVFN